MKVETVIKTNEKYLFPKLAYTKDCLVECDTGLVHFCFPLTGLSVSSLFIMLALPNSQRGLVFIL